MDGFRQAMVMLPPPVQEALRQAPPPVQRTAQEIRLRKGGGITLSLPDGVWMAPRFKCTAEQLYSIFEALCEYSLHTHQEELRHGYIRLKNGCRAGIAGTFVTEGGRVTTVRQVTAICLRIARWHNECAKEIGFTLSNGGRLHAALICGEPASGKTSLLRDLVRCFCTGAVGRPFRMAVVDERGELNTGDWPCETLLGCPKATGVELALRNLAPEGIALDELGDTAECAAVLRCLHSGVAAFATAHADSVESLCRRAVVRKALCSGAFEYVVLLRGRHAPGEIAACHPVETLPL